jgi:hypothetical protein
MNKYARPVPADPTPIRLNNRYKNCHAKIIK